MNTRLRSLRSGCRWLGAAILAGLAAGCASLGHGPHPVVQGPLFTPRNYTGVAQLPSSLRRVVLLPVAGADSIPAETLAALDPVMAAELQLQARFEVVTLDAATLERLTGHARLLSSAALPPDLLPTLARASGADGVMFVDVTALSAYSPLALGLKARLVSVSDGAVLWAFDQLFTTGDPTMAESARRYDRVRHPARDGDLSFTVLQSPVRFGEYAAAATFATLPPR